MGHHFFIISILEIEAVSKLAPLLGCCQLELQSLDTPDVVRGLVRHLGEEDWRGDKEKKKKKEGEEEEK